MGVAFYKSEELQKIKVRLYHSVRHGPILSAFGSASGDPGAAMEPYRNSVTFSDVSRGTG